MKVISIKEPFATLIMNGSKKIETRSWKTNYRGEIFIHASRNSTKEMFNNNIWQNLSNNLDLNYGKIICKCNLVDCIYMDRQFIDTVKRDQLEYSLGIYEIGRYAWILENIEHIYQLPAKGKLNIWNFDGKYKLLNEKNIL